MDRLGLYVKLSLLTDKTMLSQAHLHCFFETKDYRVEKPENWVSKLNSCIGLGLYVGSSHAKTKSEMTKPSRKNMKVDGRSWGIFKLCCKKGYIWCSIEGIKILKLLKNLILIKNFKLVFENHTKFSFFSLKCQRSFILSCNLESKQTIRKVYERGILHFA